MKYKLRNEYTHDPEQALYEILMDRGVTDIESFVNPTSDCELDPYDLENIDRAANKLLMHLRADNNILCVVDADCDGFTSSSILWLYIKNIFPQAKLDFTVHEHKAHGLEDKIDWLEYEVHYDLVVVPDAGKIIA